jgi:methylated-DNA-[protein]-cysteine S-methyltransferase
MTLCQFHNTGCIGDPARGCYDPSMNAQGYTLFDTAIGCCGIAWSANGVVSVQLPQTCESETRARLRRRFPETGELPPPAEIKAAVLAIILLLRGESSVLDAIRLDMEQVPEFHRRVYAIARSITPGATLSYGDIASRLAMPGSARAVGQALGRNPFAIIVPCHRVLAAGGKVGGFSASGGIETKRRLLEIEGALSADSLPLFGAAVAATAPRDRD